MKLVIKNSDIDITRTFQCGQCFRWKQDADGVFRAIVKGKQITARETADGVVVESEHSRGFLENYFDLNTDYGEYIRRRPRSEIRVRTFGGDTDTSARAF